MGIALWLTSGLVAFILARLVPLARPSRWIAEAILSAIAATTLGIVATYLDFGGWGELDWRAAVFALCGALASLGVFRLVTSSRGETLQ